MEGPDSPVRPSTTKPREGAPTGDGDPVVSPGEVSRAAEVTGPDPETCPVCGIEFDSVSVHDTGLLVNLRDNQRYRRVCFEPVAGRDGRPLVRFFHHTHART